MRNFLEGRYDRGYGRPVAGRIDGYEVRNYGWNLGDGRSVNRNRQHNVFVYFLVYVLSSLCI